MTSHLTDESFAELLAGEASRGTAAHLENCEPCRREAARVCGALVAFKAESLAGFEARVEARPRRGIADRGLLLAYSFPYARSLQAAAALLLVGFAVSGVFRSGGHAPAIHEHPAGSLVQDNQLLLSIDQELSAQGPGVAYAKAAAEGSSRATVSE